MPSAPKGYSLHIGLNFVDPAYYEGWNGELAACEADADDMELLASAAGYEPARLIRGEATRDAVIANIKQLASKASSGDICLLTYSGHGGQVPDITRDEADGYDETWCLFDGQLLDDELELLWHRFKPGVRILVVSDSCHSETISRAPPFLSPGAPPRLPFRVRTPPLAVVRRVYQAHRRAYDEIQIAAKSALAGRGPESLACTVRTLSGCLDSEVSYDGEENGQFTAALLATWDFGRFRGDYTRFHRAIAARVGTQQTPQHNVIGAPDRRFDAQQPFQIDGSQAGRSRAAAARGGIELEVHVSGQAGVRGYSFAYEGVPFGTSGGHGTFPAVPGRTGTLEWAMLGDPGGTMKVEVLRDGSVIKTQEQSTIVPPFSKGWDALEILVS